MKSSFSEKVERMQSISHLVNKGEGLLKDEFISGLKTYLDKKGYRADLCLVARHKPVANQVFPVEVKYNPQFEFPPEKDLMALVAEKYNGYEIDWETVQVDTDDGLMNINLRPAVEMVPLSSMKEIPPEFIAAGTGIFKRKASASGDVMEIWELRKSGDNLALIRKMDDLEVTATEEPEFKAGEPVDTPEGVGRILRFDEAGNAFVQIGSKKRLFAAEDLKTYKVSDEKSKLVQYFTDAYGDADFAKGLVEEHGDAEDRRKKM